MTPKYEIGDTVGAQIYAPDEKYNGYYSVDDLFPWAVKRDLHGWKIICYWRIKNLKTV